ncbi:porin family protein [Jiulongibacter sediminis]|uniref:porin family protein n=1 Tax=Jiulongibacter sediminis TaxID=1605367 RepID=UPI0009E9BA77|nr:porin family protein [Jiulongibacter sediminis]
MKKLLSLVLIALSFGAVGQTSIGVRGAITGSTFTRFDLIENITPEFRFMPAAGGAVFVEIPVSSHFSVQPELSYIQKGFAVREGIIVGGEFLGVDIPVNGKVNFRSHYVEMPVLAKFHIGDKEAAHYYLALGPSVGYLADADMRIKVLDIFPVTANINENFYKPFEFSGVAALGFELPVAKKIVAFTEARYTHGFSRVLDTPVVDLPVRSRTLAGGAGIKIKL